MSAPETQRTRRGDADAPAAAPTPGVQDRDAQAPTAQVRAARAPPPTPPKPPARAHAARIDPGRSGLVRVPRRPHAWRWWIPLSQVAVLVAWLVGGWRVGLPLLLASHALILVPVFVPRARLYAPVLATLPARARQVWLTIDDGPSDDTAAILDLLDRHGAVATFFLVGARAQARPDLVREIVRRGHGIGNHSHTHPQAWFWALGPRRMRGEIDRAQATLTALAGRPPRWFRSVVGMTNPFVAAPLRSHGLTRVAWSARGFDAVRDDPQALVAAVERDLAPGAVVLLHEGARHGRNVAMIAALLARLDALGYRSVLPEPEPEPGLGLVGRADGAAHEDVAADAGGTPGAAAGGAGTRGGNAAP